MTEKQIINPFQAFKLIHQEAKKANFNIRNKDCYMTCKAGILIFVNSRTEKVWKFDLNALKFDNYLNFSFDDFNKAVSFNCLYKILKACNRLDKKFSMYVVSSANQIVIFDNQESFRFEIVLE